MNIVFIITRADQVGGATVHVRDISAALIARGDNVTVLVGGAGPVTSELMKYGIPYRSMRHLRRSPHPVRDLLACWELCRHLVELRPDLVSTHTAKAGLIGRAAAKLVGIPAVFTPHGWAIADRISPSGGFLFRISERIAARFCAGIVNVCEYEKELAKRYRIGPERRLFTVHNGMCDVPHSLRANPSRQPPRLIMVARMDRPKDHGTLLRALANLTDQAWTLELIGAGPLEPGLRREARELGLSHRVLFSGTNYDVADRLCASDLFVLSTRSEAFPRSILEAMRAGLPVVASNVGGISESVLHNETGFLVPRNNSSVLAAYLRILIENPGLRQSMGSAGRRRYETKFTFERMMSNSLQIYHQVAARPSALALVASGEA